MSDVANTKRWKQNPRKKGNKKKRGKREIGKRKIEQIEKREKGKKNGKPTL